MRGTDVLRSILDLIDSVDQPDQGIEMNVQVDVPNEPGEQTSRFRQILAMITDKQPTQYSNSPAEVVTNIGSVTTDAGGGVNGSKHPHDIRVKDPSAYPNQQEY